MPSMKQWAVASALVSLVSASPVKQVFTVHQSRAKVGIRTGPAALANAYAKFDGSMPADVAAAAATNDGTVAANPEEYDSAYLSPVTIGGQLVNLDFDTGSSDLWVYSSELSASAQSGHSIYNPSQSTTSQLLSGYTWNITYGDGSTANGNVFTDTVSVGTSTVTSQAVEAAQTLSPSFLEDVDIDGLLGLGFDRINTVRPVQQKTFFSNVKGTLASPLFTVDLKKGTPGSYDFGFIDSSKYSGSITYVNINSANGFWEFASTGYAIGTTAFRSFPIDAIADTGTTLLLLPSSVVTAYYAKVSGATYNSQQGGYTFPCSAVLPSITFGIGSYKAVVPGSYINYAPISSSTCFGGVQADTGIGFSIFGDIFLKSQFVVFNGASTPQLGFAAKRT